MSPLVIVAGIAVLGVFVALAYRRAWQWTGLPAPPVAPDAGERSAKTLWDWLQLLGIPLALAALAFLLNNAQANRDNHREDQRDRAQAGRALDAAREDTLRTYLAQMSDLMLNHELLGSTLRSPVGRVAQTVTRITGQRLDSARNTIVLRFLSESHLLASGVWFRGVDLRGARLRGARLNGMVIVAPDFSGADLIRAHLDSATILTAKLRDADLTGAYLNGTNLVGADLSGADLSHAHLNGAYLRRANLTGANLNSADLRGADVDGANLRDAVGADLRGSRGRPAQVP